MKVSELSEQELIARVQQTLASPPAWLVVGIGDDGAVVEPERNRIEVLTVDAVVEGVHFDRRFTPADAIGHRALAVNLSDIAAMGAAPRLALLSMVLPPDLPCADFDAIVLGLARLAAAHRVHVVGGNLTRSPGPLVIDVTVMGTAKRRSILTRAGARAGDDIYVTGTVGAARAGLLLLRGDEPPACDGEFAEPINRYLRPEPRVRTGMLLGRARAATACMDLSDGLADAVTQVARASGVGAMIDGDALPIDPATRRVFESRQLDPVLEAARGGDDYELLLTVRPRWRGRLLAARAGGAPFTRIGSCTPEPAVRLKRTAAGAPVDEPMPSGFSHFR